MKVILLCGGQGTRLREETEFRPKPLVSVGGRPILWHIMKSFSHSGLREFVVCLGYRGNMIKEYFLNYEAMTNDFTICLGKQHEIEYHDEHTEQDFRVSLADTGQETMTGGRLKRVQRYVDGDTFILTYGDGLADVDIRKLIEFHHSHGKIGTVTTVQPTSRFGILDVEDDGRVTKFAEKPQASGWASAGYFVFNKRIFDYLEGESDDCILERRPLERLSADGELIAYRHNGFFFAMDTFREYQYLNELWNSGKAPWKTWE
jgi:glucose-1-phosphate cytidylyltransferase